MVTEADSPTSKATLNITDASVPQRRCAKARPLASLIGRIAHSALTRLVRLPIDKRKI